MMQPPAAGMPPQAPPQAMPPQPYYAAPPQPQWGIVPPPQPPQYHQPQPSPMWNQQPSQVPPPVPPQQMPVPQPQYQSQTPPLQQDEARTLWIGDLQYWMEENYVQGCFASTGEVVSVKIIRNKQTGQPEGYGFVEFATHATADRILQSYAGQMMPNSEQRFKLNWASIGGSAEKRDFSSDYSIFVGDLSADVTDYMLQETFRTHYPSVRGAKVVIDRLTGRSKGYGFVKFGDPAEQARAMTEMNGMFCSTRAMRTGPATSKKTVVTHQVDPAQASYHQPTTAAQSESDPNNTTIFVGGLDATVTDDQLRQVFGQYGELIYVKIPAGKQCGFVQFSTRASAEEALLSLNGSMLGGRNIRLSWGRSPANKQVQTQHDANQWNGNYYGYGQGYEAYGYAQPPPDPNMYAYGGAYPGYGGYQQQQ